MQIRHQHEHRAHLIEEAKKAYAAKLVAEKAGPNGEFALQAFSAYLHMRDQALESPAICLFATQRERDLYADAAAVISDPDDPKFDLEKLMEAWDIQ